MGPDDICLEDLQARVDQLSVYTKNGYPDCILSMYSVSSGSLRDVLGQMKEMTYQVAGDQVEKWMFEMINCESVQ